MTTRRGARNAESGAVPSVPAHLRELEAALPAMMTFAQVRDDALRCSTRHLRDVLAKGEMRCIRRMQGARVLIPRSEVLRWLAERST